MKVPGGTLWGVAGYVDFRLEEEFERMWNVSEDVHESGYDKELLTLSA